jgi:signal transduction histidine kinase
MNLKTDSPHRNEHFDELFHSMKTCLEQINTQIDSFTMHAKHLQHDEMNHIVATIIEALKRFNKKLCALERIEEYIKQNNLILNDYLKEYRHDMRNYINILQGFSEVMVEIFQEQSYELSPAETSELFALYAKILQLNEKIRV